MKNSYRDLEVWQRSMEFAVAVYKATESFPKSEMYGLTSQLRRASISVPSNIAEGYGRRTAGQRHAFLEIALGSIYELETQIELAARLDALDRAIATTLQNQLTLIGRGVAGLMRYVAGERNQAPRR